MKLRQGFVSNSSSSSFIAIGMRLESIDKYKLAKVLYEKYPIELPGYVNPDDPDDFDFTYEIFDSNEIPFSLFDEESSKPVFGYRIYEGSSDDYGVSDFEISADTIIEKTKEIQEIAAEVGVPCNEIKVIGGEQAC
ncbi:MAG: hypothetical protein ABIC57_01585 [bacterium]